MKEQLEQLKNCDLYWLLLTYFLIPLFGPFAAIAIFIAWIVAIFRHRTRVAILQELIDKQEIIEVIEENK